MMLYKNKFERDSIFDIKIVCKVVAATGSIVILA